MSDFLRLNLKYLIPTKNRNQEVFNKLKPGETLLSKVIEFADGKALLNIKGTEVLAESKHHLAKGDIIQIKVQDILGDKVFVELNEGMETQLKETSKAKFNLFANELKDAIIKEGLKESIGLKKENLENIMKLYTDISPDKIDKKTIKTLLLMESNKLNFSKELFDDIDAYVRREKLPRLEIDENFEGKLKEAISNIKTSDNPFERGLHLLNNLRNINNENIFEYIFFLGEGLEPAEIKVEYEDDGKDKDKKDSEKNSLVAIKLDLEKLGKLEIKVNLWKNIIDMIFYMKESDKRKYINSTKELLKNRLESKGFTVGEISIRTLFEDDREVSISEVNITV